MMKGTIICYGDSNTYGYDPRTGGDGRYPETIRWTGLLLRETGYAIKNHGICGREIPHLDSQIDFALGQVSVWKDEEPPVGMWIMLGTNDLLSAPGFTAADAARRMGNFLKALKSQPYVRMGDIRLRVIAPPAMKRGSWVEDDGIVRESKRLGAAYSDIARLQGVDFTDAASWDIPLVFDGVHFSAEGHRRFADGMKAVLL